MHRCQRGALPASFIILQVNKTIFYNTTGNLNNERMFLFSTRFSGVLLSGPTCTTTIQTESTLYCCYKIENFFSLEGTIIFEGKSGKVR